jgi:hypothetical protein
VVFVALRAVAVAGRVPEEAAVLFAHHGVHLLIGVVFHFLFLFGSSFSAVLTPLFIPAPNERVS